MDAGLTDALAASRPFATPVTGSKPIDHVLVTPGLTGRDAANKDVPTPTTPRSP